jgi:hypothetical protein
MPISLPPHCAGHSRAVARSGYLSLSIDFVTSVYLILHRANGRSKDSSPALSHRRIPTSTNVSSDAPIPTKFFRELEFYRGTGTGDDGDRGDEVP